MRRPSAEVAPDPDAFLTGRVLSDTGSMQLAACAGLTFGSPRPSSPNDIWTIKSKCSSGSGWAPRPIGGASWRWARWPRRGGSGKELIRVTPVVSWCLGMQYIFCTATQPLTKTFNRLQIPFIP